MSVFLICKLYFLYHACSFNVFCLAISCARHKNYSDGSCVVVIETQYVAIPNDTRVFMHVGLVLPARFTEASCEVR